MLEESSWERSTRYSEEGHRTISSFLCNAGHIKLRQTNEGLFAEVHEKEQRPFSGSSQINGEELHGNMQDAAQRLLAEPKFDSATGQATTDVDTVRERFEKAENILFL